MDETIDLINKNYKDLSEKYDLLLTKIETLVDMNKDLINANLKMSNTSNTTANNQSANKVNAKKKFETGSGLFYELFGNGVYIHGYTFSNKDKIKELGGRWDGTNSRWVIETCDEETIIDTFPDIIKKETISKCLI